MFVLMWGSIGTFAQKFDDAVDYNDYIVNEQFAIIEEMEAWSTLISELAEKDVVLTKLNQMLSQIEISIKKVKKLDDYEGNTAFRDAAIELFSFYGKICGNEYKELVEILYSEDLGEEELTRMNEIVEDITIREQNYDEKFISAQKEFAEKHNFILE